MYFLLHRLPSSIRVRRFSTVQDEKRPRNHAAGSNVGLSEHSTKTELATGNPVSCKGHCFVVVCTIVSSSE